LFAIQLSSSTATLIIVSVVFLALNVPSDVYFLLYGAGQLSDLGVAGVFYSSVNLAVYTNNSINFLMYFASGRKFRTAAADTMACRWFRGIPRSTGGKPTVRGHSVGGSTVTVDTAV
jgi:hypothetical protein